jgi:hypothetical protein
MVFLLNDSTYLMLQWKDCEISDCYYPQESETDNSFSATVILTAACVST